MSIPIPISRAGLGPNSRTSNGSNVIEDNRSRLLELASRAPVIGSLPGPLNDLMPGLDLPPASPDSVSLAAILTADTTRRLVGVSSAPARSFMENARRARAALGTSPTVLSILEQQAKASIGNTTSKVSYSGLFAPNGGSSILQQSISESVFSAATGLDSELDECKEAASGRREYEKEGVNGVKSRRELAVGSLPSGGSKFGGGLRMQSGSASSHVVPVLATSFREPSEMPMALPEDFEGNSDDDDDDSADEAIIRKSNSKGGRSSKFINNEEDDDDDEDEEEKRRGEKLKKNLSENEGGVFGEGLED